MEARQCPCYLDLTVDLADLGGLLQSAEQALESLRTVSLQFKHNPLPMRRFHHREALASARMAGSTATMLELLCFEETPEFLPPQPDAREALRHLAALECGLDGLSQGRPLDAGLLWEVHAALSPEPVARPYQEAARSLTELLESLESTRDLQPLLQAGVVLLEVASGERTLASDAAMGRVLSTLIMAERTGLTTPAICLSPYFEKKQDAFEKHLRAQPSAEALQAWLSFFLGAIRHQALDTTRRIQALLELMDHYRGIVLRQGKSTRTALKVMRHLVNTPFITAKTLMAKAEMSAPTAQAAIRFWMDAGVIQELTGRRWGRIYLGTDLFRLTTEDWPSPVAA